jgi:peptidoglycan/xylan/chitin deacetylase (PgdA/CDA1 family)
MRHITAVLFFLVVSLSTAFTAYADKAPFTVVPWNGYKAAVSLTFDDGDPIHLDLVIPELQKRDIRGTFFLIAGTGRLLRPDEWKKAAAGMEIGNHSMTHRHAYELTTPADIKSEVDGAAKILRELSGQPVLTFSYPYLEITEDLRARVEKECFIARGGGTGAVFYPDGMDPDWYDIKARMTTTDTPFDTYKDWIDQSMEAGAWTIFLIHAIEGSNWYQPVPKDIFLKTLDYLQQNNSSIWIAPFGEIGAYWKAQKALEGAKAVKKGGAYVIKWGRIPSFPAGVVLKVKVDGEGNTLTQAGIKLEPVSSGIYLVSFDTGELTIRKAKIKIKL